MLQYRCTRSDADGYHQFTQLDLEYGTADNSRLALAYLRVTAARTGYYDHAPVAVPKFSADVATTVRSVFRLSSPCSNLCIVNSAPVHTGVLVQ